MSRLNDSKGQVFEKEHRILAASKSFLSKNVQDVTLDELRKEYEVLSQSYEQLLGEVKLLTSVSDRLQNKLNRANETVVKKNEEIKELQENLNRTRISRKATTIIMFGAAVMFLISEWLVDPMVSEFGSLWGYSFAIIFKLILVLSLKPLVKTLEHFLLKTATQSVQDLSS